jgi:hypothetical protein
MSSSNLLAVPLNDRLLEPVLTTLENQWLIEPIEVNGQTLTLNYGSGDGYPPIIEFFASVTPGSDDIQQNCDGQGGTLQKNLLGYAIPLGFTIISNSPVPGTTQLAFTFERAISDFVGYDGTVPTNPTVEFCVKVTLGRYDDSVSKELAVKFAFTLNGSVEIADAVVFNEDNPPRILEEEVEYGINAYRCDIDGAQVDRVPEGRRCSSEEQVGMTSTEFPYMIPLPSDVSLLESCGSICVEFAECFSWMLADEKCYTSTSEELLLITDSSQFSKIQAFTVNAGNCDDISVSPGESIYICLESDNEQASVASVSSLELKAQGTDAAQTVVDLGEAASLATGSCVAGKCQYEVILNQVLFKAISAEDTTTTLSVGGTAVMALGSL